MDKMGIGIIGCGTIANASHIPSYLKDDRSDILYFCDTLPDRAREAVERYGCGAATADFRDVIGDSRVAAVSVCVPNDMHAPISIAALQAGKHVLCEKPAARTYAEALTMQAAQKESGKILNIGVVNRFNEGVNRIRGIIEAGELGEVYHVYASFRAHRSIPGLGGRFTTKAASGGGALIDWGVHFLDIVMYCCGDPKPVTASGEAFCKLGRDMRGYAYVDMWAGPPDYDGAYDVEDSVAGLIRTEGPVITLHGAWAQNIGVDEMYIDFMGTEGGVRLLYGAGFKQYTAKNGALLEISQSYAPRDMFGAEISSFLDSALSGEKSAANIDTAIITARLMQAIYDSSACHREIVLA